MAELKPCPFCGGKAELMKDRHEGIKQSVIYRVVCQNSHCFINPETPSSHRKEYCITAWNRRADNG